MLGPRPVLAILLIPVLAGAQEPSGLEKAKQDLKTLPSVRKESDRPAISLPNIAAPSPAADLPAPMPSPNRSRAATEEAKDRKGTDNWLVDAMMKDDSRQTGTDRKGTKARAEAHPLDSGTPGTDRDSDREPTGTKESVRDDRERASDLALEKVENPLTPFMADWISKRDHALLLPKSTPEPGFGTAAPSLVGGPGQAATVDFRRIDGRIDPMTGPVARPPVENPFLQALQVPAVPPPAAAPVPTPPGTGDRAPALMPPEPVRDNRSLPPIDLSKPSQDSKYFPQLKRF